MEENNTNQPDSQQPADPNIAPPPAETDTPITPPPSSNKLDSLLKNKKMLIFAGIGAFALIVLILFVRLLLPSQSQNSPTPTPTIEPTSSETPSQTPSISASPSKSQSSSITPTAKPSSSPTPTSKPTATNTPTPTRTPTPTPGSPPQVNISYPTEGQSITMNSSQTFCVADTPVSNTQGLQRRQNTGGGWSDYASINTLCYSPTNGANTLELQYKNSSNLETSYTIHFNFQRN